MAKCIPAGNIMENDSITFYAAIIIEADGTTFGPYYKDKMYQNQKERKR